MGIFLKFKESCKSTLSAILINADFVAYFVRDVSTYIWGLDMGILSYKFLLRQHDNGNLIVATITTMKYPDKIKLKKEVFDTRIIEMFLKHKLGEFQALQL